VHAHRQSAVLTKHIRYKQFLSLNKKYLSVHAHISGLINDISRYKILYVKELQWRVRGKLTPLCILKTEANDSCICRRLSVTDQHSL